MKKVLSTILSFVLSIGLLSLTSAPAKADGCANPMTLTYDLSLLGGGLEIALPLGQITGSVEVNWGDGNAETFNTSGLKSHTYATATTYTLSLCGDLNMYGGSSTTPATGVAALTAVTSFGDLPLVSFQNAFSGATNLTDVPATLPTGTQFLYGMFRGATSFNDADVVSWDTSTVTTMGAMFRSATNFNQDISFWDTSAVTQFSEMFYEASSFNQNIGGWDTGSATSIVSMFEGATVFNNGDSGDLNSWDVSGISDFSNVFRGAAAFNQNIGSWNTSNAVLLSQMFMNAASFNNGNDPSIKDWNVGKVRDFQYIFYRTPFNQPIGTWNIGEYISIPNLNLYGFFEGAYAFNQPIDDWDVSKAVDMGSMFSRGSGSLPAMAFNQDIGSWEVGNVLTFRYMFWNAGAFNNGGSDSIKNWGPFHTNAVMDYMFMGSSLNQPIGEWDISNVKSATYFITYSSNFDQDLSNWNIVSIVTSSGYAPGAEKNWSGHLDGAFNSTGLSTPNYDALLIGLASRIDSPGFNSGVKLGASGTKYSCNAVDARTALVNAGMVITDAGQTSVPAPALTSVSPTAGGAIVSWTLPDCNGVPVTPTAYQMSLDNGNTWFNTSGLGTMNSVALSEGSSYSIRVRVVTAGGTSSASNMIPFTMSGGDDETALYVVPDNQTIAAGSSVPSDDFYTYTLHEGSASGAIVSPTLISAPTCTSSYTTAMTSSDSPLTISCSGGSADGYSFDTSSTAVLSITAGGGESEPEPEVDNGPKYTVRYNANGATAGEIPIPAALVTQGKSYTVLSNFGGLVKTGYVFSGWSDGFKNYQPGDSVVVTTNFTLYAVWTAIASETSGTYTPINLNQTRIEWDVVPGVTSYQLTINGRKVYAGSASSFTYSKLVGPASKVKLTTTTASGSTSSILKYQAGKKIYGTVVRFAENSSAIPAKFKKRLSAIATLIRWQGFKNLMIIGYTDSQGGSANAARLSKARAKAVAEYLKARGVNASFSISGEGIAPVSSLSNLSDYAKSRRALLWIVP